MYAVIFRASIKQLDEEYVNLANRLRQLALEEYGCTDFVSTTEGEQEIAVSYWHSLESIRQWKQNTEHLVAQRYGQEQWYRRYSVDIVKVVRHYQHNSAL